MKKIMALVFSVMFALSMTMVAFAEEAAKPAADAAKKEEKAPAKKKAAKKKAAKKEEAKKEAAPAPAAPAKPAAAPAAGGYK